MPYNEKVGTVVQYVLNEHVIAIADGIRITIIRITTT